MVRLDDVYNVFLSFVSHWMRSCGWVNVQSLNETELQINVCIFAVMFLGWNKSACVHSWTNDCFIIEVCIFGCKNGFSFFQLVALLHPVNQNAKMLWFKHLLHLAHTHSNIYVVLYQIRLQTRWSRWLENSFVQETAAKNNYNDVLHSAWNKSPKAYQANFSV